MLVELPEPLVINVDYNLVFLFLMFLLAAPLVFSFDFLPHIRFLRWWWGSLERMYFHKQYLAVFIFSFLLIEAVVLSALTIAFMLVFFAP